MPWFLLVLFTMCAGCLEPSNDKKDSGQTESTVDKAEDQLTVDPKTGVPYAYTFQYPLKGFDSSDFGFGFGSVNDHFCMAYANGMCTAFGAHLGRDSQVKKTPVGTLVFAPADGVVRISTNETFGGYGSDSQKNPSYRGCLLVLEHEFPNGQPVLTLLGHVQCEAGISYDPLTYSGNPPVGTIVRRDQYVAHVAHYWSGVDQAVDWHHLHWAMRVGPYKAADKASFVAGYGLVQDFSFDPVTHTKAHPIWMDPFVVQAANGDPVQVANSSVRHHPSGSLLRTSNEEFFQVLDEQTIAKIPATVLAADRYDLAKAVLATPEEIACYHRDPDLVGRGAQLLYKHSGSSAVAIASASTLSRQDFVRWEALLSWGFTTNDVLTDPILAASYDALYTPQGLRRLRPGSLVKADETSEVCIVRPDGKRQPIASAEIFEALGYAWEQVYSVPAVVLDEVAGPRVSALVDSASIHACAVTSPCPSGGICGGGGGVNPCDSVTCDASQTCLVKEDGKVACVSAMSSSPPVCSGECTAGISESCEACPGVLGTRTCSTMTCTWSTCFKPNVPEVCGDGIDNDCNGAVDCFDPACASASICQSSTSAGSGGAASSSGSSTSLNGGGSSMNSGGMGQEVPGSGGSTGSAGSTTLPPSTSFLLRIHYEGELMPGLIVMNAWWQPPADAPRVWGPVTECADQVPGDGILDCVLPLPHGTTSLEFQLDLPNGGYWGDASCYPKGGCGKTNGIVTLFRADTGESVSYELIPNKPGEPYLKAHLSWIP